MDITKLFELAKPILENNDFGVSHTHRVFNIAKQNFPIKLELQKLTFASIILHDIGGRTIIDQYEKGPPIATALLKQLNCSSDFIKQVCDIISTHHEHPDNPSEPFKTLYDADKLVMFSPEEYPTYNAREGFDWDKIVNLIYSKKGRDLAQKALRQRRNESKEELGMFFKQIHGHGDNFSYLISDDFSKEAAVVDSSYNADEIAKIIKNQHLKLKYIINTHGHSDHTAGNSELQSMFGAKVAAHTQSKITLDLKLNDGEFLNVGMLSIKVIYTPGHTSDSICLLVDNKKLLTGDTLFVGECGRTDLPSGNSKSMYDSLFNKLMKLSGDAEVYPGHDYGHKPYSTIGEEKQSNYTLKPRSLKEFIDFMSQP
jgi:hydroxyacylglutathione hydrolase